MKKIYLDKDKIIELKETGNTIINKKFKLKNIIDKVINDKIETFYIDKEGFHYNFNSNFICKYSLYSEYYLAEPLIDLIECEDIPKNRNRRCTDNKHLKKVVCHKITKEKSNKLFIFKFHFKYE